MESYHSYIKYHMTLKYIFGVAFHYTHTHNMSLLAPQNHVPPPIAHLAHNNQVCHRSVDNATNYAR